jgi:hypothetical protein
VSFPGLVDAPADRPGGTDTRQETSPVTVAGSSPGSRSLRGLPPLSCFLRWVFRDQSMKTTNAENDGKAHNEQFDILASDVEALDPKMREDYEPWPSLMDWLTLPAFAFRRFPVASTLYVIYLLEVAFLFARAYGWL